MISIIIPTYNESKTIDLTLSKLSKVIPQDCEVIVIDGFSNDNTQEIVKNFNHVKLFNCKKGRSVQMNFGAQKASKDFLLFLHADTILNSNCIEYLTKELKSNTIVWGWFSIKLNNNRVIYRFIEIFANLRARLTGTPLGDHAIFVKKGIFDKIGGFPDIPLLEDLEFVRKLKCISRGKRINTSVITSVRRFENSGILKTCIKMWMIRLLYYLGFSTQILVRFYDDSR
ncbi:MAG TPA: TIGR04283 family arsenosugar biosynthesis glycosyltransferase [Thermodesulfobacteriota bacterium]|jgi:rSAM/selenodomain-associated transferase 2